MAFLFGKKKKQESVSITLAPPKECEHKFSDFPWFLDVSVERDCSYYHLRYNYTIKVIEPYVCIFCKERKDVILDVFRGVGVCYDDFSAKLKAVTKQYEDHLQNRAVIEDMISDMQLVDREYLKYYRIVKGLDSVPKPKLDTDIFTPKEE